MKKRLTAFTFNLTSKLKKDEKLFCVFKINHYFCELFKNEKIMTVVNSKEFAINQEKYFDLAIREQVYVKRDNNMFLRVSYSNHREKLLWIFLLKNLFHAFAASVDDLLALTTHC